MRDRTPQDYFDEAYKELVEKIVEMPLEDEATTTRIRNLRTFSECRIEVAPDEEEPTTKWGKFKCGVSKIWDNETTRTAIKAGGAFAGVIAVVWTTVHRDHVIEREALNQANRNT